MTHTRRQLLAVAGSVPLVGCFGASPTSDDVPGASPTDNPDEEPTDTAASPVEPSVTDVSLLLNWKPSGLHVPYFAAANNGFYEDEGLDVTEIESGQGSDFSAKQVGLGNVEFAITSSDQVLNVNTRDLSPRCVAVVMQGNPVVLFSAREHFGEELTDASQLAELTVGSGPGMVRQMVMAYLDQKGILNDVKYVDTGFDTVQQLLTGEIDAAGGVFTDVVDAKHQDYTIDVLRVHEVIPSYGHVIATDEGFAADHPETVRAFMRATARGAVWANQHPQEGTDVLVNQRPELTESQAVQRDKWEVMRTAYMLSDTVREHGWGWSAAQPWETTYNILKKGEFLEGEIDPESVWTNEYLDTDSEYIRDYADLVTG